MKIVNQIIMFFTLLFFVGISVLPHIAPELVAGTSGVARLGNDQVAAAVCILWIIFLWVVKTIFEREIRVTSGFIPVMLSILALMVSSWLIFRGHVFVAGLVLGLTSIQCRAKQTERKE